MDCVVSDEDISTAYTPIVPTMVVGVGAHPYLRGSADCSASAMSISPALHLGHVGCLCHVPSVTSSCSQSSRDRTPQNALGGP
jgi:hypothetical protein